MPKALQELPELSAWNAEILRLTVFHQPGPQTLDNSWWEDITGTQAESKAMKPREGGYEVSGPYAGATLTLKADIQRFDWLLTPATLLERAASGRLPFVGALPAALDSFSSVMQKWLPKAPSSVRLAFGAVVLQEVTDRIAGYKLVNEYLPYVTLDPEGSTEFSYSINRSRVVGDLGGIKINRLSRWSVAFFQSMSITMMPGQAPTTTITGAGVDAVRLEVDINTDADRKDPLPQDTLPAIADRLIKLGTEIVCEGDIK